MPAWLIGIIANLLLKFGVSLLEKKYPGLKPFIDKVLEWLKAQPNKTNAVTQLSSHCDALMGCPSELKTVE